MCESPSGTRVWVPIAAMNSPTGHDLWKRKGVDSCLADIVAALNRGGVPTLTSCCGHGRGEYPAHIPLWDGRVLVIYSADEASQETGLPSFRRYFPEEETLERHPDLIPRQVGRQ